MTEKLPPDWELAERLFRAGQLSLRMIAAQSHVTEGAIRKKAKKEGWKRDLTEKVQEAVRTALVRNDGTQSSTRVPDPRTEREIIEQAAENAVAVVRQHRRDLNGAQRACATLFAQLMDAAGNRLGDLDQVAQQIAAEDGVFAASTLARFRKAMSLPTHAGVLRDLSTAMKNFQTLERQAWNLAEGDDGGDDSEGKNMTLSIGFVKANG